MNLHRAVRTAFLLGLATCCGLPGIVQADQNSAWNTLSTYERQQILSELDAEQFSRSNSRRFSVITSTASMTQAALNDRWYQHQQSGQDSGLRLVWQGQGSANLISVSEAGLSLTRRF